MCWQHLCFLCAGLISDRRISALFTLSAEWHSRRLISFPTLFNSFIWLCIKLWLTSNSKEGRKFPKKKLTSNANSSIVSSEPFFRTYYIYFLIESYCILFLQCFSLLGCVWMSTTCNLCSKSWELRSKSFVSQFYCVVNKACCIFLCYNTNNYIKWNFWINRWVATPYNEKQNIITTSNYNYKINMTNSFLNVTT